MSVTDNGSTYFNAYTNYNTILISYVFSVPVLTTSTTYFLEASQEAASFVYLSTERSASIDNNPLHENDVPFSELSTIDYVVKDDNDIIATVNSTAYTRSLTATYFGVTRNTANLNGNNPDIDALIIPITVSYNFNYAINRSYNTTDQKYYLYIAINILTPSAVTGNTDAILRTILANYNFNFAEWSYLDSSTFEFVYSDVVVMNVNNKVVDWPTHYY